MGQVRQHLDAIQSIVVSNITLPLESINYMIVPTMVDRGWSCLSEYSQAEGHTC